MAVDLALPRNADVGLLVPSIVDLVRRDTAPAEVGRWRLARIGGSLLDESMTLNENNVRDGDLLVLTAGEAPALRWVSLDPYRTVADAIDSTHGPAPRIAAVAAMLCAAGIGAAALWWSGLITRGYGHLTTGALVAAAAAIGAIALRRAHDQLPCVALSVIAVRVRRGGRLPCRACGPVGRQRAARGDRRARDGDRTATPDTLRHNMFDGGCHLRGTDRSDGGGRCGMDGAR